MTLSKFARYTWGVLVYNIMVILFGAFVRATGSGAGCGAHWPLCNGVVIPRPERIETLIEFTHRVTSGLVLVLAVVLVVWAWRLYQKGSLIRWSSALVLFFTITEALVGAGLVLFGWVADDDSIARAISMMVHLVNTFLLVGSLAVTAWWVSHEEPAQVKLSGVPAILFLVGFLAMLILGASGAVTALGDTLFPASSLLEGIQQEFSDTAHYLLRLRVFHPAIAVSVGVYLYLATTWIRWKHERNDAYLFIEPLTRLLHGLFLVQIILGVVNVALLAPVWMQIVHLLVTNLIWIVFILLGTVLFSRLSFAPGLSHHQVHDPVGEAA